MAAIELYTPQGAEMVSGMMYEPYEQGVIMRLEHHLVGGYVRYISPYIIIKTQTTLWFRHLVKKYVLEYLFLFLGVLGGGNHAQVMSRYE